MNDLCTAPSGGANRARRSVWPLTVVGAVDLESGSRRLRLVSEIDGFRYAPGQPMVLKLPRAAGQTPLPAYTVRGFDPIEERLEIDVLLRDDSPAVRWVRSASLGDALIAEVVRARLMAADAD